MVHRYPVEYMGGREDWTARALSRMWYAIQCTGQGIPMAFMVSGGLCPGSVICAFPCLMEPNVYICPSLFGRSAIELPCLGFRVYGMSPPAFFHVLVVIFLSPPPLGWPHVLTRRRSAALRICCLKSNQGIEVLHGGFWHIDEHHRFNWDFANDEWGKQSMAATHDINVLRSTCPALGYGSLKVQSHRGRGMLLNSL